MKKETANFNETWQCRAAPYLRPTMIINILIRFQKERIRGHEEEGVVKAKKVDGSERLREMKMGRASRNLLQLCFETELETFLVLLFSCLTYFLFQEVPCASGKDRTSFHFAYEGYPEHNFTRGHQS